MKKVIYFLIVFITFYNCTVDKEPEFIKIADVRVSSVKNDTIRVKAAAFFKNPNGVSGKISTDKISVFFENQEIAQVFAEDTRVPANKEFFIPLEAVVPTQKILQGNKNGLLSGILNAVFKKSIVLNFKGKLTYKKWFYKKEFLIDSKEEIKLKL
jgi:hypothetical protein